MLKRITTCTLFAIAMTVGNAEAKTKTDKMVERLTNMSRTELKKALDKMDRRDLACALDNIGPDTLKAAVQEIKPRTFEVGLSVVDPKTAKNMLRIKVAQLDKLKRTELKKSLQTMAPDTLGLLLKDVEVGTLKNIAGAMPTFWDLVEEITDTDEIGKDPHEIQRDLDKHYEKINQDNAIKKAEQKAEDMRDNPGSRDRSRDGEGDATPEAKDLTSRTA